MFELLKQFCVTIQQQELLKVDGCRISSVGLYTSAHSFQDLYITHQLTLTFSALWGWFSTQRFQAWGLLDGAGWESRVRMHYWDWKSLSVSLVDQAWAVKAVTNGVLWPKEFENEFGWQGFGMRAELWLPYCDQKSWEWIWLAAWLWKQSWDITQTERVWESLVDRAWLWRQS